MKRLLVSLILTLCALTIPSVTLGIEHITEDCPQTPPPEDEEPLPEYLVGAYYFAGWWRNPVPAHYLVDYAKHGDDAKDWREEFPERKPEIGWYDDRQKLVDEEIALAAAGGLDFFAFDYYTAREDGPDFPGALENNNNGLKFFLTSPNKSLMRFVIAYVNSAKFAIRHDDPDGGIDEWHAYIKEWVCIFKDPQYLKINGKPVFIILGAGGMRNQWGSDENVQNRLQELREAVKPYFPDVLIGGGLTRPTTELIDRAVAQEFDFLTAYSGGFSAEDEEDEGSDSELVDGENEYEVLLNFMPSRWDLFLDYSRNNPEDFLPYAPVVVQGLDRRAVEKFDEPFFVDGTPELFKKQLEFAKDFVDDNPEMRLPASSDEVQKMVVIYAWNELGEGGILIPTKREGDNYLRQVGIVFEKFQSE